jgi:hypothetical protein
MKKGGNIPDMSGPQGTRVYKMAQSAIDNIEYRHDHADVMRAYYADAIAGRGPQLILGGAPAPASSIAALFDQPRIEWFYFEKFQKRFALCFDHDDGEWELDGAPPVQRPDDGDPQAVEGGPPDGPSDGPVYSFSGGFHLPPLERRHRARPPRRGRRPQPPTGPADQGRAPAQPPRDAVAAAKRIATQLLCKTERWMRTMQVSSRFGHIKSKIRGSVAEMREIARLTRDTARALATVARRMLRRGAVELRALFTDFDHTAHQAPSQLHAKAVELREGFTLVLYSFDNPDWNSWLFGRFEHPNWESWLFGRLSEDERLSA